jgi:hypothetical protein
MPHWVYDAVAGTVLTCSILHSFLPPWDWLADFPRAQKYYKAFIYLVGYIAINGRSTVYQSLSMKNQAEP